MANPQKEHGYTGIANELLEAIIAAPLSGGQLRLLLHLIRQSYGYNTTSAQLSATAFAKATGLHPKVVAREMRELEERQLVIVFRVEGRTSTYKIQKDYSRWQTGNLEVTGNQTVPGTGNLSVLHPEPNGSRSIYKVSKDSSKDRKDTTEPHGSGTLRDRFEAKYRESANKTAVFGELFSLLLGGTPDYRRLGAMAKRLNSGGKLLDLIIDGSKRRISDDPHDYLDRMVSNEIKRQRKAGSGETVILDNGREVSADVHRSLSQIAKLDLGGR